MDAEKWLESYLSTNFNSNLKLRQLSRIRLIQLAEQAGKLSGDQKVQFERLLMEADL